MKELINYGAGESVLVHDGAWGEEGLLYAGAVVFARESGIAVRLLNKEGKVKIFAPACVFPGQRRVNSTIKVGALVEAADCSGQVFNGVVKEISLTAVCVAKEGWADVWVHPLTVRQA